MFQTDKSFYTFFSLPRTVKRMISAVADFLLLHLAFFSSLGVLNLALPDIQTWLLISITSIATQITLFFMGFYSSVIRYLNISYLFILIIGAFFAQFFFKVLTMRFAIYETFWFSEMVVTAMVVCVLLGGIRIVVLSYFNHYMNRQKKNVIIYGAGDAGQQLASSLLNGEQYLPIAFIDDNRAKQGTSIRGIKVHPYSDLHKLIKNSAVNLVLLALPKIAKKQRQEIIENLAKFSIAVKKVPQFEHLLSGSVHANDLQDIEVEDLLGRDPVAPQPELLARNIYKKNVLVTGAGGSIGSELCRQICQQHPASLILFDLSEFALYKISEELKRSYPQLEITSALGSVLNKAQLQALLEDHSVHTIYHAAAYKHVPLIEGNPIIGVHNNVFGTLRLAEAAVAAQVDKFILISTDKAVRPTNIMGASKRIAELILQAFEKRYAATSFSMVRFGNVLGSSGSVVPLFKQQIVSGGPVTVTHKDVIRYFMTIPEAAQLVIQAGAMGEGGDVFILDMGEPVSIDALARRMVFLMGYKVRDDKYPQGDVEIHYTGLRPGEKLYEELLIGDASQETDHPRIMRAQEDMLAWSELEPLLMQIQEICQEHDASQLRALFTSMPLWFTPEDAGHHVP